MIKNFKKIDFWSENAKAWDESMLEGSPFQKTLIEPDTLKFLDIQPGMKVLDIACGNGQMSRCLARLGAHVTAIDVSNEMIRLARARSKGFDIEYLLVDITNRENLIPLKNTQFDAILCNMALIDIEHIDPVFEFAYEVLKVSGVFVFSITHPCFDKAVGPHLTELHENEGTLLSQHSIKVQRYLTSYTIKTRALPSLPSIHNFFHRSLGTYLNTAFDKGFVMCGISEPAFPQTSDLLEHKGWHKFPEIPVVFIAKLKK